MIYVKMVALVMKTTMVIPYVRVMEIGSDQHVQVIELSKLHKKHTSVYYYIEVTTVRRFPLLFFKSINIMMTTENKPK